MEVPLLSPRIDHAEGPVAVVRVRERLEHLGIGRLDTLEQRIDVLDVHKHHRVDVRGRLGLSNDTVIIFASDHGLLMGEYGMGGKALLYDLSAKIPCFIHDPSARSLSDQRRDELVSGTDLTRTILDYAGVKPFDETDVDFTDRTPDFEMLFDLEADSGERHNLIDHPPADAPLDDLRATCAARSEALNAQRTRFRTAVTVEDR